MGLKKMELIKTQTLPTRSFDHGNNGKSVHVLIGGFYWGSGDIKVKTVLGSCVSICMWNKKKKMGGLCHFSLPGRRSRKRYPLNGFYGDDAIHLFLDIIKRTSTVIDDYEVEMYGGASMFDQENDIDFLHIGQRNIESSKEKLKKLGFKIKNENCGGTFSRHVTFDLSTGLIHLRVI